MLPFTNMSGERDQEYFADGISEDLITGLARIRWLFVIARNSSFVYKNRAVDVKEVSRALGVRYVLEGSVRRAGNRLRITAQLVDATTGGHHWAERYDRELGDIFAVQDEITRSVAGGDRAAPAGRRRACARCRARRDDLGAWELVARAQTHCLAHDTGGLRERGRSRSTGRSRSIRTTRRRASLLGFCLVFAAHMGWIEREQGLVPGARARRARDRARRSRSVGTYRARLLGDDGTSHGGVDRGIRACCRASIRIRLRLTPISVTAWRFAGQDREAIEHGGVAVRDGSRTFIAAEGVRALSRSANDLGAWEMVARAQTQFWRMTRADYEAAIGPLEQAVAAYPNYAPAHGMLGQRLAFASHMGWVEREDGLRRAREHAGRAIALDELDPVGHMALGYWAEMERRTEESIAACRRAVALNPNSAVAHTYLSHIFAFAGRHAEAIAHGEEAIRLSPLDPDDGVLVSVASPLRTTWRAGLTIRRDVRRRRCACALDSRVRSVSAAAALAAAGRDRGGGRGTRARAAKPSRTLDRVDQSRTCLTRHRN